MIPMGRRLKDLRKASGYTQEGLAKDFNKKYNYRFGKSIISQYENDKKLPSLGVLFDLADFFGVSTDFLLGKSKESILVTSTFESEEMYTLSKSLDSKMNFENRLLTLLKKEGVIGELETKIPQDLQEDILEMIKVMTSFSKRKGK